MSKAEQILKILRDELRGGYYKPGTKFPSEQKLMKRFHTSRITINKVTSVLADGGFIKRGVQGSGTRVLDTSPFPVGFVAYIGPVDNLYYARMIRGIQRTALLKNYALCILSPGENQHGFWLEKIRHSGFRGLLATGIGTVPDLYPIPVVYLDHGYEPHGSGRGSVTCTNYRGAAEMMEQVIMRGHREILVCSSYCAMEECRMERIRGFLETLKKHRIHDAEKRFFHEAITDSVSAKSLLQNMLRLFPKTTVILTDSDDIAYKLLYASEEMLPTRQIAITGFGNLAYSSDYRRLPGVEQHPEEIGAQGTSELLRMIADSNYVPEGLQEIETDLVHLDKLPILNH